MTQQKTIDDLERLKVELLSKVQNIDQTIALLRALSPNALNNSASSSQMVSEAAPQDLSDADKTVISKYKDYNKDATMLNKVAFILKTENRFLHLRQIARILHLNEPEITEKEFTAKLYPAVAKLKSSGVIVKYSVGTSNVNTFWGSKNWLNDDGTPKDKHKFDEQEVTSFGSEVIEI